MGMSAPVGSIAPRGLPGPIGAANDNFPIGGYRPPANDNFPGVGRPIPPARGRGGVGLGLGAAMGAFAVGYSIGYWIFSTTANPNHSGWGLIAECLGDRPLEFMGINPLYCGPLVSVTPGGIIEDPTSWSINWYSNYPDADYPYRLAQRWGKTKPYPYNGEPHPDIPLLVRQVVPLPYAPGFENPTPFPWSPGWRNASPRPYFPPVPVPVPDPYAPGEPVPPGPVPNKPPRPQPQPEPEPGPVPVPVVPPVPVRPPLPRPGPRPSPNPPPAPDEPPVVHVLPSAPPSRPPPRTRERKFVVGFPAGVALTWVNDITEVRDFVDALESGLPFEDRAKPVWVPGGDKWNWVRVAHKTASGKTYYTWERQLGHYRPPTLQEQAQAIYQNIDNMQWDTAFGALLTEQAKDMFYGRLGRITAGANRRRGMPGGIALGPAF